MKSYKGIKHIVRSSKVNMGGIIIEQPLPNQSLEMADPFLLIHHWSDVLEGGKVQQNTGVGPHPHRGFSPVTFVFKGGVHHRDSRGNDSIVNAGGVQWMEAGMGIVHSERPTKTLAAEGGAFEIIQFWLNLPARHKMGQPRYLPLQKDEIPLYLSEDRKAAVGVIAGTFNGVAGKIEHPSPVTICRMDFKASAKLNFDLPAAYQTLIYILDGKVNVNGSAEVQDKMLMCFDDQGTSVSIDALTDTRAILLAGIPLGEKVTSYGPFVMNEQTEVMEAMRDAQQGKMGVLIEDFS